MTLRILVIGVLGLIAAGVVQAQQQAGPAGQGPRPFTISPQAAAKLQQQQQQLQQQHQQQHHHHKQQQHHHHPQPNPPPAHFQPQRPAPPPPPQNKPQPPPQSPPKYITRNRLDEEAYQKPRFSAPPPKQNQLVKQQQQQRPLSKEEEEDYYEDEGPDKLTELLQKSKFECNSKKDGYYADETLNCEVFHYCQDAKKHSWMCPENMNFHQVHLICMPPSQDNICTKSTSYHFVNEYLYRPINEKEAASTNASLKYADRYYPQGYTPGMAIDELQEEQPYQPRAPHRFGHQNVFYNPESVNIPLTQRRPPVRQPQAQQSQSTEYYDE